jgi:hypothetical protein
MGGVLRLTGLPAPQRCPVATVRRVPGVIELRFLCRDGRELPFDVDVGLLGPGADPEAEELRLLARLADMGYDVRRLTP